LGRTGKVLRISRRTHLEGSLSSADGGPAGFVHVIKRVPVSVSMMRSNARVTVQAMRWDEIASTVFNLAKVALNTHVELGLIAGLMPEDPGKAESLAYVRVL
jgi:hypothetical protein